MGGNRTMSNIKGVPQNVEDKLFSVKYKPCEKSHLQPTPSDCARCKTKPCTTFCPAKVYVWDEEGDQLLVGYENCLECGACRIGCTYQSIKWEYPEGGCGVTFKNG